MPIDYEGIRRDLKAKIERDAETKLRARFGLTEVSEPPTAAMLEHLRPLMTEVAIGVVVDVAPTIYRAGYEAAVRQMNPFADNEAIAALMDRYKAPAVEQRGKAGFEILD